MQYATRRFHGELSDKAPDLITGNNQWFTVGWEETSEWNKRVKEHVGGKQFPQLRTGLEWLDFGPVGRGLATGPGQ